MPRMSVPFTSSIHIKSLTNSKIKFFVKLRNNQALIQKPFIHLLVLLLELIIPEGFYSRWVINDIPGLWFCNDVSRMCFSEIVI